MNPAYESDLSRRSSKSEFESQKGVALNLWTLNPDELVKSQFFRVTVIPAKAGIQ